MAKCTEKLQTNPSQLNHLNPQCAGIDIGASELFVCIAKNPKEQEVRSFLTFTSDLRDMIRWLKENNIKSVAMESTGVYWIAPYEMLDSEGFEVLLVNPHFLKSVPGRKTDVKDCQWIQQLHSYGLLSGSFRPENEIVELRSYVRLRTSLFSSAGAQVQLMHKALTQMNIQLNHAISKINSLTGLRIVRSILKGEKNPKFLAELSVGLCRKNKDLIEKALEGNYRKEHLFALKQAYKGYEFFHKQIEACEKIIEKTLRNMQIKTPPPQDKSGGGEKASKKHPLKTDSNRSPYGFDVTSSIEKIAHIDLTTIPGIDGSNAMVILSEIGTNMSKWRNGKAFASWLGLCPGNKISGGKVLSSKTRPTDNRAAQALRMAAFTLHRSKTALGAFFRRMKARLGTPKAITATAHKLCRILYNMLKTGESYKEAGENYYEQQYRARAILNLKNRAKELGYIVAEA